MSDGRTDPAIRPHAMPTIQRWRLPLSMLRVLPEIRPYAGFRSIELAG